MLSQACLAWTLGVAFLFSLVGLIVLTAHLHWQEAGGVCMLQQINSTAYSIAPEYAGCREGASSRFLPDQGAWWYYWRLPEPTVSSRVVVWTCYVVHQFSAWFVQFRAQKRMMAEPEATRYSSSTSDLR